MGWEYQNKDILNRTTQMYQIINGLEVLPHWDLQTVQYNMSWHARPDGIVEKSTEEQQAGDGEDVEADSETVREEVSGAGQTDHLLGLG